MKIQITTNAKTIYNVEAKGKKLEEIVEKILEQKYILLNENVAILTSSIVEIKKI